MKCCMSCKFFKSYRELYNNDPLEPDYCGVCDNDMTTVDGEDILKMQDDYTSAGDEINECKVFKQR